MNKRKIMLIAAIVLPLLLTGGGLALATRGFSQPLQLSISVGPTVPAAAAASEPATLPEIAQPTPALGTGILMDMGAKVVNLADPGGYRYLRIGLVLEFVSTDPEYYRLKAEARTKADEEIRQEITERRAVIDDTLINCVSDKAFGDIFSFAGKEKLKEELRTAINTGLGPGAQVSRIYFTDFVIN